MNNQLNHIHAQVASRVKSILNSEPGKLRPKLASYLAFDTSMPAAEAIAHLNVSAKEQPDAMAMWGRAIATANRSLGF